MRSPVRLVRRIALVSCLMVPALGAQQRDSARATAPAARTRPARIISSRKPWVVSYDHLRETMTLRDDRGREQSSFAGNAVTDGAVLRIPPDRPVEVRIVNANPMLYTYDVTSAVVQERRSRSCRAVLGSFAQAGLQFRALSMGEIPARWAVDTVMRQVLTAESVAAAGGPAAMRGEALSAAERARTIALVTERVQLFESRANELAAFVGGFSDSLATAAELADAVESGPYLDALLESIRRRVPGARRSADVALAVRALSVEAMQPANVIMQLSATGESDIRPLRLRFDSALTSTVRSYRQLQTALFRVEQYRAATEQRFTVAPSGDYRALRIALERTPEFPAVSRFKLGTVEALTDPAGGVSCRLAPGLALADTPNAFLLRNDTIVQSNTANQRTAASLLLHFDVANLRLPVGALAGIGLGANKAPDWYLGGSFRLSDVVRINAGAIWQREQQLPAGRTVGGVTPVADRAQFADLSKRYRPAFFWGVSLVP